MAITVAASPIFFCQGRASGFTMPAIMQTIKAIFYGVGLVLSAFYMLNLGAGVVLDFIPDTVPVIGNIDEALVSTVLVACIKGLWRWRAGRKSAAGLN